jgi:hypothetical protein
MHIAPCIFRYVRDNLFATASNSGSSSNNASGQVNECSRVCHSRKMIAEEHMHNPLPSWKTTAAEPEDLCLDTASADQLGLTVQLD